MSPEQGPPEEIRVSLVPCPECGHQISTTATTCPNCGAPAVLTLQRYAKTIAGNEAPLSWGRVWKAIAFAAVPLFGLIVILGHSQNSSDSPPAASRTGATAVAAAPERHWSTIVHGYFAYKRELSANDQANGMATAPMMLVGYQGHQNGHYEFSISDGGPSVTLMSCDDACEFVTASGMAGNRVLPVERDSLLWAVVEDAKHGYLDQKQP